MICLDAIALRTVNRRTASLRHRFGVQMGTGFTNDDRERDSELPLEAASLVGRNVPLVGQFSKQGKEIVGDLISLGFSNKIQKSLNFIVC
jgi:hypothetical protein